MRFERRRPGDFTVPDTLRQRGREQWLESSCVAHDRPLKPRRAQSKFWCAVAAVLSRLREHAIEGFAACAAGMYPELFHPLSGQADPHDLAEKAPSGWPVERPHQEKDRFGVRRR
jgi:hypothetical protein